MIVVDGLHHSGADADGCAVLSVIGLWAGAHGNGLHSHRVGSQGRKLRGAIGGVTGFAQFIGDKVDGEFLSGTNLAGCGIDLGRIGKDGLLETVVHNVLIDDVKIAEDSQKQQISGHKRQQPHAQRKRRPGMISCGHEKPDLQLHRRSL